jgi:peptidoglycan/LPS O-acetylase OafA/YrhL
VAVDSLRRGRARFAQQRSFPGATPWFNAILATPTGLREVLLNLASVHSAINSPLWSVQIELEIAPFLPLLVWPADRLDARLIAPVFIALCYASLALWAVAPNAVSYAYCFYLGIALPKIIAIVLVASMMRQPATLVACLLVLLPVDWGYCTGRVWMPYKFIVDAIVSAEIIGFVLFRPDSRFSHALLFKPLVTLGNLSYSFYAFHMSVLIGCSVVLLSALPANTFTHNWAATAGGIVLAIGSVSVTLALGAISYATIERRGREAGRKWGRRIEHCGAGAPRSPRRERCAAGRHLETPRTRIILRENCHSTTR